MQSVNYYDRNAMTDIKSSLLQSKHKTDKISDQLWKIEVPFGFQCHHSSQHFDTMIVCNNRFVLKCQIYELAQLLLKILTRKWTIIIVHWRTNIII